MLKLYHFVFYFYVEICRNYKICLFFYEKYSILKKEGCDYMWHKVCDFITLDPKWDDKEETDNNSGKDC